MTALACVAGRFQPVHAQHLDLFAIALRGAEHLVVAVTNPDRGARRPEPTAAHRHRDESNPFTYFERARMLSAALAAEGLTARATIVPFDLTRPQHWPDYVPRHARQFVRAYSEWERYKAGMLAEAGYPVKLIEGDPAARISGSDIRARMLAGGGWEDLVPDSVVPVLRAILAGP